MLEAVDIFYSYDGRAQALQNLSVHIPQGITILAGPNAGGKTTLLRLLAGLLVPTGGRILNDGAPVSPAQLRQHSRMVMQDADPQILGARVGEDILLGQSASNIETDFPETAHSLCAKLGLDSLWDQPVESLSYGQKRKLCLVHALMAGPQLLLLDEPFAGLDYPSGKELRHFIQENKRNGLHQILSTHELEPVFDLADHIVVVENGAVPAEGAPEALRDRLGEWSIRTPGGGWQ